MKHSAVRYLGKQVGASLLDSFLQDFFRNQLEFEVNLSLNITLSRGILFKIFLEMKNKAEHVELIDFAKKNG